MNRTKAKLVLDGITHAFTDGEKERTILDGLSLEVGEGELVAVTGPSGSGKSTFLSIAGALLSPDGGEVRIDGQPLSGMDAMRLAQLRLGKLGFIFQSANLIPYLKVEEQLLLVARLASMPRGRRRRARGSCWSGSASAAGARRIRSGCREGRSNGRRSPGPG